MSKITRASLSALLLLVFSIGCDAESKEVRQDGSGDAITSDLAAPLDQRPDATGSLHAFDYCEQIVDFFCPFYLRCGRMAELDLASCKATFLETCNAIYEPEYIALEQSGYLELSAAGIAACKAHLQTVACDHQLLDLEGPCKGLWVGKRGEGQSCGIDYDSFVCDGDSTCVISPSFCGVCGKAAKTGQACSTGSVRCRYPDQCVAGTCVGPALPGQDCGDRRNCIAGATCAGGSCVARRFVAVGQPCNQNDRCPYRSACIAGTCVRSALLGESCADRPCASGYCEGNSKTCHAFLLPGAACADSATCLSQSCNGGHCAPVLSGCF